MAPFQYSFGRLPGTALAPGEVSHLDFGYNASVMEASSKLLDLDGFFISASQFRVPCSLQCLISLLQVAWSLDSYSVLFPR